MLLKEWVPSEFTGGEYDAIPAARLSDAEVVAEFTWHQRLWAFTSHKNVMNWCIVQQADRYYAVGWNENPAVGWSFPMKRLRGEQAAWAAKLKL